MKQFKNKAQEDFFYGEAFIEINETIPLSVLAEASTITGEPIMYTNACAVWDKDSGKYIFNHQEPEGKNNVTKSILDCSKENLYRAKTGTPIKFRYIDVESNNLEFYDSLVRELHLSYTDFLNIVMYPLLEDMPNPKGRYIYFRVRYSRENGISGYDILETAKDAIHLNTIMEEL